MTNSNIEQLALKMCQKMDKEGREGNSLGIKQILQMVGAGIFSLYKMRSDLYSYGKGYLRDPEADIVWERFNIRYLKRKLQRLEKQKLVEIKEKAGKQIVVITDRGRNKILQYSINEMTIKKPDIWDGRWWVVSYDLPEKFRRLRLILQRYFLNWNFYPLHESVYLHAYSCKDEVTFLKEYLGIGEYVKVFDVRNIDNDKEFRKFYAI